MMHDRKNSGAMIGKTRHAASPKNHAPAAPPEPGNMEIVFDPKVGRPRGVLRQTPSAGKFRLARRSPVLELALHVQHYWIVSWDLRGEPPFSQETLPHPNVHAVFEKDRSAVCGISTSRFTR